MEITGVRKDSILYVVEKMGLRNMWVLVPCLILQAAVVPVLILLIAKINKMIF